MDKINVGLVSLGCDKNRVDAERLLYSLNEYDCFSIVPNAEDAEVIIVNTCAFIESAIKESIDTIFEMSAYKDGKLRLLVVTGCLAERFYDVLIKEFGEIDLLLRLNENDSLAERIASALNLPLSQKQDTVCGRIVTTPSHYAYLKISDGCNNFCSYCTIPYIRGRYRSTPIEELVEETRRLIEQYGVKELDLVAQDTTRYGVDLYGTNSLIRLLDELSNTDVCKIRLNYCYPELVTPELIRYVSTNPKLCKYLDIPLQHVNDTVLRSMNRRSTSAEIRKAIDGIRTIDDSISIRSTFIVGFSGETEEQFGELLDFLNEYRLDNVGFFAYSREEGTKAFNYGNRISSATKKKRLSIAQGVQSAIMRDKMQSRLDTITRVLVDGIDYDKGLFFGHDDANAPDVDKKVYFVSNTVVPVGEYVNVRIDKLKKLDYYGREVK